MSEQVQVMHFREVKASSSWLWLFRQITKSLQWGIALESHYGKLKQAQCAVCSQGMAGDLR
jgi:hypothetical protein